MIERHPLRLERFCLSIVARDRVFEICRVVDAGAGAEVVEHDDMLHARQRRAQFLHHLGPVVILARIADAVAGDQHFRVDLLEAIEHSAVPMSGEHELHTPPMLAVAKNATIVSMMFGR